MKNSILIIFIGFILFACKKNNLQPTPPPYGYPIDYNDSTVVGDGPTISDQTWVLKKYRVGEFGNPIDVNDTIHFINNNTYTFSGYSNIYHLYPTMSTLNLNLYSFLWGDISGTITESMINFGNIPGVPFHCITPGNTNFTNYYLWIERI